MVVRAFSSRAGAPFISAFHGSAPRRAGARECNGPKFGWSEDARCEDECGQLSGLREDFRKKAPKPVADHG